MFTAVVRVTGTGRLEDFRERVRWLMVRDADAEDYTEHHGEGLLEYRFTLRTGIPFPAFTAASEDYPELRVEAEWDHAGARGHAVIENGRLVQQSPLLPNDALVDVTVREDGALVLALACARLGDALVGYAATAERHTYFRFHEGMLSLVDESSPDEALEAVAFPFVEEWIWYDEEEAPVERARYAGYGYPVRGANVRSEKLALLREKSLRHSTLDAGAEPLREALLSQWLSRA